MSKGRGRSNDSTYRHAISALERATTPGGTVALTAVATAAALLAGGTRAEVAKRHDEIAAVVAAKAKARGWGTEQPESVH